MNDILDYGNVADRNRLSDATAGGKPVLVQVMPFLTGRQFVITSSGMQLSRELFQQLRVSDNESYWTVSDFVQRMDEEDLAVFALESCVEAARLLAMMSQQAAGDDISAVEKQQIALDILQNLKNILPFEDEPGSHAHEALHELQERLNA